MDAAFLAQLEAQTQELRQTGIYKDERKIASPQQAVITLDDGTLAALDEIFPGPGGEAPVAYAW